MSVEQCVHKDKMLNGDYQGLREWMNEKYFLMRRISVFTG